MLQTLTRGEKRLGDGSRYAATPSGSGRKRSRYARFDAYAERLLGPRLRRGDVVVLNKTFEQAIGIITKADIRGWFTHCGYSLARK